MSVSPPLHVPTHHAPEAALLEHVSGATGAPSALAIACHIALCPACAAEVSRLEAVAGSLLDASPGEALSPGALESVLARLDTAPEGQAPRATPTPPLLAPYDLPRPLLRRLAEGLGAGTASAKVAWRYVAPGVRGIDLAPGAPEATARVISFKGGITIPLHDHGGPEHILVFSGALEEEGRRFERGDLSIRAPGQRHQQRVAAGEPCIALVINEGPLQPLTLRGRLLLALSR